jgi:hypothetical protein
MIIFDAARWAAAVFHEDRNSQNLTSHRQLTGHGDGWIQWLLQSQ